jgi:hypothetical protein
MWSVWQRLLQDWGLVYCELGAVKYLYEFVIDTALEEENRNTN